MRSARPDTARGATVRRLAVLACLCLLATGAAGCSTTQEKAAAQKVKAERILEAQGASKKAKAEKAARRHRHDKQKGKK
ncbi:MAG TPA: hypothetical protein VMF55_17015 [Solirubrobacterales bacterium]|nr:hypothetical protein [Solirubrobacterales bacterium]